VVFADVNGDGILDVIGTGPLNQVDAAISVSLGNGGASFQPPFVVPVDAMAVSLVAVADVNGDHKPDLVAAADFNSTMLVLLGNGDGTFQQPNVVAPAVEPTAIAVGDLNGDGKPDLAFVDSGTVAIAVGVGDGTFQTPVNGNKKRLVLRTEHLFHELRDSLPVLANVPRLRAAYIDNQPDRQGKVNFWPKVLDSSRLSLIQPPGSMLPQKPARAPPVDPRLGRERMRQDSQSRSDGFFEPYVIETREGPDSLKANL
jgi:hypothetical protein